MTTTPMAMFDSVDVAAIPVNAQMVAGYVDGNWPTYKALKAKFRHVPVVSIATSPSSDADVLDVERGDAQPADVPAWVVRQRRRGAQPIVYCSRSLMGEVEAQCASHKVAPPHYWAADWTGEAHLVSGTVATQWANGSAQYPGLAPRCDTSLVSPNWPGLASTKKGGTAVNITTPSVKQLASLLRQLGALAAVVLSVSNTVSLPAGVRASLVAGASAILSVEHYVNLLKA